MDGWLEKQMRLWAEAKARIEKEQREYWDRVRSGR